MYLYKRSPLQWVLSGALGTGLVLAPVFANSAYAQTAATAEQTPAPGQQGNWGQAGPPPDVQNGQIPPPESGAQDAAGAQDADQGPSQYPGQQSGQEPSQSQSQYPAQAPGQGPNGSAVGYGQNGRPAYQPQAAQSGQYNQGQYQRQQQSAPPPAPVTLNQGLLLPIRTSELLDSKKVKPGDYFQGTVAQSIYVGNVIAIPRGAEVTGRVVDVKKAGELKGNASIALQLTSLNLGGNSYPLTTDVFDTSSPGKGGYSAGTTVGTAALGAVIGAVAGGGPGAAIGAVAGTGVGLGASAATSGPRSVVPPEALISFHLTSPATVQPLSMQDARGMEASAAPPERPYPPQGPYAYGAPVGYPVPPPPVYGYAPYPYVYGYPYGYRYGYRPYPYGRAYYYGRWR